MRTLPVGQVVSTLGFVLMKVIGFVVSFGPLLKDCTLTPSGNLSRLLT
jgi:hypothetical protein